MPNTALKADLVVVGGGMAGLAAAAFASEAGARVTVVEKGAALGGSAALSAGILWTAPDFETLRHVVPGGDPELGRVLVDGFAPSVDWVRSMGVPVSDSWMGQMGFGIARLIDMPALIEAFRQRLEKAGGTILFSAAALRLLTDSSGRVFGAQVSNSDGIHEYEAGSVMLATGGFQGDPELLAQLIGPGASDMLVRSNPRSTGDGFRLGSAVGAAASSGMHGFYGHLVPSPMAELRPEHYLPLTQYYSNHAILVNRLGVRFTDESVGDEVSNQATLRQPGSRAIILCDQRVRTEFAASAPYPHGQVVDRIAAAQDVGGRVAQAGDLDQLVAAVAEWGVPPTALAQTVRSYVSAADGALTEAPFYAVEVQPSITFPFGGLAVDVDGRVLDAGGHPIAGLFAAGADAGGLQDRRYVGGLILGLVFGPRAARAALQLRSTTEVGLDG